MLYFNTSNPKTELELLR